VTALACTDVRALAAEAALGLLSGSERSDVLAHLAGCSACSDEVDQLAAAADRLLLLAPRAEPPAGFESTVLAAISHAAPAPQAGRRHLLRLGIAAALLVVALLGAGLWLAGRTSSGSDVAAADMRTGAGRVVGEVYLHDGDPGWVFVVLPGWDGWRGGSAESYALRAELADGRSVSLGELALGSGHGGWGTTLSVAPDRVRAVSVVDSKGRIWCSAEVGALG
jgi:hypothetical protein